MYDLGTCNQVKIQSEVMIPETRELEFANLCFIPLSYYKKRDYSCFLSAIIHAETCPVRYCGCNGQQSNTRLPHIFLLSRIAH
jgi:type VI secretion system protein ImpC